MVCKCDLSAQDKKDRDKDIDEILELYTPEQRKIIEEGKKSLIEFRKEHGNPLRRVGGGRVIQL